MMRIRLLASCRQILICVCCVCVYKYEKKFISPDFTSIFNSMEEQELDLRTQIEARMNKTLPPLLGSKNPYRSWLLMESKKGKIGTLFSDFIQSNPDWRIELDQMYAMYLAKNWKTTNHLFGTIQDIWNQRFSPKFFEARHANVSEQPELSHKRPQNLQDDEKQGKRPRSNEDPIDDINFVDEELDSFFKGCDDSALFWHIVDGDNNVADIDGGFPSTSCNCDIIWTGSECCRYLG
ncbi:hypothetical protein BC938DRAFT_481910 [Jimgerdemannia flammicorona]|uniref:Uncharacterized protein n=1 Tax=Jimgerdemannia flammicorona TaxID=994334 RepID=A0A433QF17_9FUNG|nr:hypothetical protein BC938DRAFT_481910 [Jimgerdemannia flammicorona]